MVKFQAEGINKVGGRKTVREAQIPGTEGNKNQNSER